MKFGKTAFCAVFVTYYPDPEVVDHAQRLVKIFSRVFVVDNTDSGASEPILSRLAVMDNVDILRNGRNLGIAHAP